ncbi:MULTISPECIES: high frequency lysogenization protein HflD [Thiorhodovibrio]|uniref:high frequency lysogenization protein HflD n=1 Tax=Thiorhodovibrio TaxID=61593 RepID=UPI001914B27A|nr:MULTISPECIES: high frequency lysogenization protein HflD [Thiorhodovibrio]MBK5967710.1 lysogenization regulator HflD [Thiorhodovibrio winogradskyi]WPL11658.1 High frequency lysogenization protein HflD [Thiorhodovibrio litoralis]
MQHSDLERAIALAGLHQAAHCVERIANRGSVDVEAMEPCIHSLFQVDAPDTPSVYGPPGAVAIGMRALVGQITGQPSRNLELTRYLINLLKHARTLSDRRDLLGKIGNGIEIADTKRHDRPLLDAELLASLATLYSDHVSTLEPRILVRGNPLYLKNSENQDRIRALLLSGIRSAILWQQLGGTRWQILFGRGRLLASAREYLARNETA